MCDWIGSSSENPTWCRISRFVEAVLAKVDAASRFHWTQRYVGLPFILDVGDCGRRAALDWRERFGFEAEAAPALGDMTVAESNIQAELARPEWCRARCPRERDAVAMWKGEGLCDLGLWVAPGPALPCTRRDGMVLTRQGSLPPRASGSSATSGGRSRWPWRREGRRSGPFVWRSGSSRACQLPRSAGGTGPVLPRTTRLTGSTSPPTGTWSSRIAATARSAKSL